MTPKHCIRSLTGLALLAACLPVSAAAAHRGDDGDPPRIPHPRFDREPARRVIKIELGGGIVVDIDGSPATLRLAGVDARPPYPNEAPPPSALRLTEYLTRLLTNESVYVEFETAPDDLDAWGRAAARVYRAPDGLWVNFEVIRTGFARTSPEKCRFRDVLDYYQEVARKAAKGVWSPEDDAPVAKATASGGRMSSAATDQNKPPASPARATPDGSDEKSKSGEANGDSKKKPGDAGGDTEIWITKYGERYHRAGCRFLTSTKQKSTLADAREKGRTPCQVCKPPE